MLDMLSRGDGISVVAKATGLTRQIVYRIKNEPKEAERVLSAWEQRLCA